MTIRNYEKLILMEKISKRLVLLFGLLALVCLNTYVWTPEHYTSNWLAIRIMWSSLTLAIISFGVLIWATDRR